MDLSRATQGQQQIITTLDTPLSVAAGAGSGKTFTLTNRIAYALLGGEGGTPYIDSVDEVLAITFSRSGAAELKSRIRALLQEEGLEDQARAVENAWITTIHGMCSRILREHALELGIDPAFEVVEDTESEELWQQALEAVLERWRDEDSAPRLKRLIEWFPPKKTPTGDSGIGLFLSNLREALLGMPDGFESVCLPEEKIDIDASFRALVSLGEEYQALSVGFSKLERYEPLYLEELETALSLAHGYLRRTDLSSVSFESADFDMQEFFDVLLAFPKTSKTYHAKKPDADFFLIYRETYAQIAQTLMQVAATVLSRDLLELLKSVDYEYQSLKGAARFDNTDLLRKCYEALEAYPSLREAYQSQFKLIMVDEFQDTDLLQVAIVDHLSREHGANVMTVGDAQQGIYRFRGADVEVFSRHRDMQHINHENHQMLSLPDNFRSHGDILKFVDAIFSKQEFFGGEFLSLYAKGAVAKEYDSVFDEIPRIEVDVLESQGKGKIDDVRARVARSIAARFARLRSRGVSPSNMVVLLGGMPNVAIYSRALAEAGFESVIASGSLFAQEKEVRLVESLLVALANQANSTVLYQVLESPLFNLSDEALYALGHASPDPDDGRSGASFAQRFWALCDLLFIEDEQAVYGCFEKFGLDTVASGELLRSIVLLQAARERVSRDGVYAALHRLLVESGLFYRLQEAGADGLSTAANLFKALGFVSDWEAEHRTLYQISDDFSAFLKVSNQSPGVLATPESEFVRIMTMHSSKGLEFDHVAVAEIPDGSPKSSSLRMDVYKDNVLFSLAPKISSEANARYEKLLEYLSDEASSIATYDIREVGPVALSDFLDTRIDRGALDDAQRLLYVGLTRAVKSLYVGLGFRGNNKFDYESKGIFGLLHQVLNWDKTPDSKTFAFDFGGTKPGIVHHEVLLEKVEPEEEAEAETPLFAITPIEEVSTRSLDVDSVRFDVVSYSAIVPDHGEEASVKREGLAESAPARSDEEMFPEDDLLQLKRESATALGIAFHRLAQRAIESRTEPGSVVVPPETAFEAQVVANDLSPEQVERLRIALDRWFASDLCARFMAAPSIYAEVPFMLTLEAGEQPIFLEGEIDGLALGENGSTKRAFFIDYKTGGSDDESDEVLHHKHLLQAQCYALALLRQGFDQVEANFIRVEREDPARPDQPQVITYSFTSADRATLEAAIVSAYHAHEG